MIRQHSPFADPEFLRSRIIIPYDYETQILAERQDEARAAHLFTLRVRRQKLRRQILAAIAFSLCGFALLLLGASL